MGKDWEAIEKILYDLDIWDDGVHGEQIPRDHYRVIIAETLLRIPESVREKVVKEAIFITVGGSYGCLWLKIFSELQSEDQLIKGPDGLVNVKIEVQIILLNFAEMEKDGLDEERMRTTVAHEIAHFKLEHHKGKWAPGNEKEADDLIVEWGFKRAYQNYERFKRS